MLEISEIFCKKLTKHISSVSDFECRKAISGGQRSVLQHQKHFISRLCSTFSKIVKYVIATNKAKYMQNRHKAFVRNSDKNVRVSVRALRWKIFAQLARNSDSVPVRKPRTILFRFFSQKSRAPLEALTVSILHMGQIRSRDKADKIRYFWDTFEPFKYTYMYMHLMLSFSLFKSRSLWIHIMHIRSSVDVDIVVCWRRFWYFLARVIFHQKIYYSNPVFNVLSFLTCAKVRTHVGRDDESA